MSTNFYAVRLWLIALRLAARRDLEVPIELAVEWRGRATVMA